MGPSLLYYPFLSESLIFIYIYFNLTTDPDIRCCFVKRFSVLTSGNLVNDQTWNEMNVVFLEQSAGNRTQPELWPFPHFTVEMPKMYIHVLRNSAVFLCTPSFSVFPFWFLSLPHSPPWQLLPEPSLTPAREGTISSCWEESSRPGHKGKGEEAEFPLFPNTPLHKMHNTGSVQHRCMALHFQMILLACPLCWDLCTNSFSFKYTFINI